MNEKSTPRIDWLDYLKVFALLGVLLNHLMEGLEPLPWFGQPSGVWVVFLERVPSFLTQDSLPVAGLKMLAWIGNYCPGVFIFASGFGLCWAVLYQKQDEIDWRKFLQKRMLRIFPLYIFLHLVFFAGVLAMQGITTPYAHPNFLLSMLGLRVTDELFFYINPAWWFIWLILQLYLVFPFLYHLLIRAGTGKFLLFACLFTLLSRLLGLAGFRYSENLYFWMLGTFFGTRLAEFCLGMAFAVMLKEGAHLRFRQLREPASILLFSMLLLFFGLGASFIRYGTLVDPFLVTMGLCGLFYYTWKVLFEKTQLLSTFIGLLGYGSYGIYLVHYLVMRFTAEFLNDEWLPIGLVTAILISLPIGIYLTSFMDLLVQKRAIDLRTLLPATQARQER